MYVLGALEGEPARFRALLEPLHAMVDAQLACQAEAPRRLMRARRRPRPRCWLIPDALTTRFEDLVLVDRRGERVSRTAPRRRARGGQRPGRSEGAVVARRE